MEYQTIMRAEMTPDLYDGADSDQIRPQWRTYTEGDRAAELLDLVHFDPARFPPGTKIAVSVPCCPECGQQVECCRTDDSCTFDWDQWRDHNYS